jgi:phosphatidylserine/phosphatidylglycerophosphate/cardiolipin synthase-like enzyme
MTWSSETLRLVGAPLWSRLGQPVAANDLLWADSLFGEGGHLWLYDALQRHGALEGGRLQAQGLAAFLGGYADHGSLLWTLPYRESSYAAAILEAIASAEQHLWLVSPYLEQQGMAHLGDELLRALWRGTAISVITHDALEPDSPQARALACLQQEALRMQGTLVIYSTKMEKGLLHAKVVVADRTWGVLGSANLTNPGLRWNVEVGLRFGEQHARAVVAQLEALSREPWLVRIA